MAIQFHCVSCEKAIEVAAEWSCRLVECPYCGDTITAPGMSQPTASPVPKAHPVEQISGEPGLPSKESAELPVYSEATDFDVIVRKKPFDGLALAGLLLGLASIVLFFWCAFSLVGEAVNRLGTDAKPEELLQLIEDASANQEAWLLELALPGVGAFGFWLLGAGLSVTAFVRNRRNPRGKLAWLALGVSLCLPLLFLVSLLLQV